MLVKGIKEQTGTLKKLDNLLKDESRKVHGVFYTNSYFSQRYLSRSHVLVDNINVKDNEIKLKLSTRLEKVGLMEIENTLDMLVKHEAGDMPGFTPEGIYGEGLESVDRPTLPEPVSVTQHLFSVDLLLIMKDVKITYQEFKIAGSNFTLINLHNQLEEEFEQTVSLLFGAADRLYFFSHFYDKNLTVRDSKLILDLIVDENITGKAITGVRLDSPSGAGSMIHPIESMISSYTIASGAIVFGTDTAYVRIPRRELHMYNMYCLPVGPSGAYQILLEGAKENINIYME